MSTETALLRAIRDTPDDDTARLVYADFVEEDGDHARGEFIRVQVMLARTPEHDPARRDLEDREHQLLAEHEARWIGTSPDAIGLAEWEFERGFLNEIAATPSFMLNEGTDVMAAHPVRRWRVQSSHQDLPEDLLAVGRRSWFGRIEAIDLAGWYSTVGELERFLTRSGFERLRELDLTDRPGFTDFSAIVERVPFRDQLKVLRCGGGYPDEVEPLDIWNFTRALSSARLTELALPGCRLTAMYIRALLLSDCCRELTSFDIRDNPIEPDGWDAFRLARCALRELDLSGTPLGAISPDRVLGQESLSELRILHLDRCGSAMANIRALAASRYWTQAEQLRMRSGTIPENSLGPLFTASGSSELRTLDVSGNYFRAAGVRGLCSARWADSLTWLGLSRNYLTDDALRDIASCPRFSRLRTLHLAYNNNHDQDGADPDDRITDVGILALAESPHLANLRLLSLSGTNVSVAGVEAILNSPHMRLTGLGLAECRITDEMIRVLANSPALARLEWLDLGGYQDPAVGDRLLPLAESRYLSPLCELNIRGQWSDDNTRAAFRERLGHRLSE